MFKLSQIQNLILPILVFLISFGLYFYTAPRVSTNFADSNEMIAASYTLGIPHPPGYPLYLIIGKLFSFLPIGEIAFRYSIFCAFFGALTVALVYLTIIKILAISETQKENPLSQFTSIVAALLGSLSLAFSYLFWLYSIIPEVFSLLNFFTALLIYTGVRWYEEARKKQQETIGQGVEQKIGQRVGQSSNEQVINDKYLFILAILSALGFLSQQLIVALVPPVFYLVFVIDKKAFIPSGRWLKIIFGFLIGFLPLIYFPLAAQEKPIIDYGNPTSLQRMWDYLSRKIYSDASGGSAYVRAGLSLKESLMGIPRYFSYLVGQFGLAIVLIGIIEIISILVIAISIYQETRIPGFKKRGGNIFGIFNQKFSQAEIFVLMCFIFSGVLLSMYMTIDIADFGYNVRGAHERMFIFSLVSFAILIGLATKKILKFIEKLNLSIPIISIVLLGLLIIPFKANLKTNDKHNFTLGEDFAYNLFANLEPNAIFFSRGDMPSFAAYYYKYVKKQRQDVTIIPFSLREWAIERLHAKEPTLWDTESKRFALIIRDIVQDNIDKRPIYFTGIPDDQIIGFGLAVNPFILSPRGLLTQAGRDFDPKENEDFWGKMRWQGSRNIADYYDWYSKEIFEQYVIGSYNSLLHYQKRGYFDLVQKELDRLKTLDPYHTDTEKAMMQYRLEGGGKERKIIPVVLQSSEDYLKLGYKYIKVKWALAAMAEFLMAKELNPENVIPRIQLGKTYELLEWYQEAQKEYEEVLKLDPNNQEAKDRLLVLSEKL